MLSTQIIDEAKKGKMEVEQRKRCNLGANRLKRGGKKDVRLVWKVRKGGGGEKHLVERGAI